MGNENDYVERCKIYEVVEEIISNLRETSRLAKSLTEQIEGIGAIVDEHNRWSEELLRRSNEKLR